MTSLVARTGRHRQRYEGKLRLVAGCIPYRVKKDDDHKCDLKSRLEILMISSPNRDDLVFPKGGWEDDETVGEAACREALEEAGVKGILDEKNPLGYWVFRSKSRQDSCSQEGGCKGHMFALKVTEELDSWPEQANHDRKWLSASEALKLSRYDWMCSALNVFLRRMMEDGKHESREELVGPSSVQVPDVVVQEHQQIMLSTCFVKPSGTQHLDDSYKSIVLG